MGAFGVGWRRIQGLVIVAALAIGQTCGASLTRCQVDLAAVQAPPAFGPQEIHLWMTDLARGENPDRRSLSPEEQGKAEAFPSPRRSQEFVEARTLLRRVLGGYLRIDPAQVGIVVPPSDKPESTKPLLAGGAYAFNQSHDGGRYVVGVLPQARWPGAEIGVDVARIDPKRNWEKLAPRYLDQLAARGEAGKEKARHEFFRIWAIKEAMLKALGTGLDRPLDQVAVLDGQGRIAPSGNWERRHYQIEQQELDGGFQLAVVVVSRQPIPELNVTLHEAE
jgi:4'-phosphopantetheinyl transferase